MSATVPRLVIAVALVVVTCCTAACSVSTAGRAATVTSAPTSGPAPSLCRLITPAVLTLAALPGHVAKVTQPASIRPGLTQCEFGDQALSASQSINALILLEATPTFLRSRKLTARQAARIDQDCVPGSVRTGHGLGTFARWCVGRPGSTRGDWVQNGDEYSLSYYSTVDAARPTAVRLARFLTIARAIARNVDH